MNYLRTIIVCLGFIGLTAPTTQAAEGIGKSITKHETVKNFVSKKSIYDLERCIILLNSFGFPVVYRQPDRTDFAMIAFWSWVPKARMIFELSGQNEGSTIVVRGDFGEKNFYLELPEGFAGCL
jgi:hypothetical protein